MNTLDRNSPPNPRAADELYPPEPSSLAPLASLARSASGGTASAPPASLDNGNRLRDLYHQRTSDSNSRRTPASIVDHQGMENPITLLSSSDNNSRRIRTLKHRIKRNMLLHDGLAASMISTRGSAPFPNSDNYFPQRHGLSRSSGPASNLSASMNSSGNLSASMNSSSNMSAAANAAAVASLYDSSFEDSLHLQCPASAPPPTRTGAVGGGNNHIGGNGNGRSREESILAAASALASLGVTSPTSSFNGTGMGGVGRGMGGGMARMSPMQQLPSSQIPPSAGVPSSARRNNMMIGGTVNFDPAPEAGLNNSMTGNVFDNTALGNSNPLLRYPSSAPANNGQRRYGVVQPPELIAQRDVLNLVRPMPSLSLVATGGQQQNNLGGHTNLVGHSNLGGRPGGQSSLGRDSIGHSSIQSNNLGESMQMGGSNSLGGQGNVVGSINSGLGGTSSGSGLVGVQRTAAVDAMREAARDVGITSARPFASLLGSDIPLTFPQKLMEVLSNPDVADIVTWLPHGKGFIILQKRKFSVGVMPLYFKHSKFTSFTRKLNRWGFARVSRGPEMGAYYHKYFQRGNYLLCMQMHCQSHTKASSKDGVAAGKDEAAPASAPASPGVESSPKLPGESSPHEMDEEEEDHEMLHDEMRDIVPPLPSSSPLDSRRARLVGRHAATESRMPHDASSLEACAPGAPFVARTEGEAHHGGTLARLASPLQQVHHHHGHHTHRHRHRVQHVRPGNASAFGRQPSIPEESHRRQGHTHQDGQGFRLVQGTGEMSQYQGGSIVQRASSTSHRPSTLPTNLQQQPLQRSQPSPATGSLLGVDTSTSRSHPLVIANALSALQSCNDQASLAAAMNKEHSKAAGGNAVHPQGGPGGADGHQVQARYHAAMQAQLRQLEEYKREKKRVRGSSSHRGQPALEGSSGGTARDGGATSRALMLEQMKQLDESNCRRMTGLGTAGVGSVPRGSGREGGGMLKSPGYTKKEYLSSANTMPQRTVARLYNEIQQQRQQQQQQHQQQGAPSQGLPTSEGQQQPQFSGRKLVRSVRRASAA